MKRIVYGSIAVIAMMATSGAMAAVSNDSLTTKGYVDAGLKYVHDEITSVAGDVSALQTTVGDHTTSISALETAVGDGTTSGLLKDVADLQDAVNGDGTTLGLSEIVKGNGTTTTGLVGAVGTAGNGTAGTGTGLTGRVEDLELQMQNVPSALQGENGVTISNGKAQITGLSSTTGSDNKMYILKNNTATELSVVSSWANDAPSWAQEETQTEP